MPFAAYWKLASSNPRLLSFGFLMAFGSSFGQTYFIGIFGPRIQSEFGLTHTEWGSVYMAGTLASAVLLPWTGRQIDRFDLRYYTLAVCALLACACAFVSFVAGTLTLVIAIFLLRQSGQGLMSHVSLTSMARYFDTDRGRALAIATLGFAAGEAVLPVSAVAAIGAFGWRWSYGGVAALLVIVVVPTIMWLLKGHAARHHAHLTRLAGGSGGHAQAIRSWTRKEVLRDTRFYLLLPGILAPSMILTAMFFHHLNLADAKGWSHAWITGNYVVYAVITILTSLAAGPLIDRFGAVRLVPLMSAPLALSMVVIALFGSPWSVWPYFVLAGLNVGIAHTAVSAMWPELYGVHHLGAIKSLAASLGVFSSALGPVIMGSLMDLGVPIEHVCLVFSGYSIVGGVLLWVVLGKEPTPSMHS